MDDKGRFHLGKTNLMAYSHGEYFALGKKLGKFGYSVKKSSKGSSKKSKNGLSKKSRKKK
jgi:hypothetical protein